MRKKVHPSLNRYIVHLFGIVSFFFLKYIFIYCISLTYHNPIKGFFSELEIYTKSIFSYCPCFLGWRGEKIYVKICLTWSKDFTKGIPFLIYWLDYFMRILGFFKIEQKVKLTI